MKYVFISNPIAGNKDKERIISRIKSTFRQLDDEMIVDFCHKKVIYLQSANIRRIFETNEKLFVFFIFSCVF